ncbi:uncharacterized protein TM35_000571090 [Trypanosoma theileri]|uniref:Mucin-associated surface protein (MASP) n=1 Tax=Trypanosoma theileri TaxID=67003 RepID=A0A1X0NGR6_9TRYP|nr:uncharacterized protein TM35_000571090 [Trypanosoma theileri]ORC83781.1 hypothetical protein TM35_000571090 [Trypanosoma theileri]
MMMMMGRVMCVLAVVLCCACGYTMTAAAPTTTVNAGQPKAVMAYDFNDFLATAICDSGNIDPSKTKVNEVTCADWKARGNITGVSDPPPTSTKAPATETKVVPSQSAKGVHQVQERVVSQDLLPSGSPAHITSTGTPSDSLAPKNEQAVTQPSIPGSGEAPPNEDALSVERSQGQTQESTEALQSDKGVSNNTGDNSATDTSNPNQQSTATDDVTAAPNSTETNATTPLSTENTTTEAPTTTPSHVPDTQISSNTIASNLQKKANVDSSVSPVWMRTAAPLLIVVVLVSATVC